MKKNLIIILMLICIVMSACGKQQESDGTIQVLNNYKEKKLEFPEQIFVLNDICLLDSGKIRIAGTDEATTEAFIYESEDGGKSWEETFTTAGILGVDSILYVSSVLAADGGILIYVVAETEEILEEQYFYVDDSKQPVRREIEVKEPEYEGKIPEIWFAADGTLMIMRQQDITAIDIQTGMAKYEIDTESHIISAASVGSEMFLLSYKTAYVYDTEAGKEKEPSGAVRQLSSFQTAYAEAENGYSHTEALIAAYGEAAMTQMYYAGTDGIYAFSEENPEPVQLLEARGTHFSNANYYPRKIAATGEGSLYVSMDENTGERSVLLCYSENKESDTGYEEEFTVYSLEDNELVRILVNKYQIMYPEIKVDYVVGLDGKNGVTAEEAIRTLNTEILAGTGPDVLILDGLDTENLITQGGLLDLTGLISAIEAEEGLMENIISAYETEEKLYAVPSRFSFMTAIGDADTAAAAGDLEMLAAQMQKSASEDTETALYSDWNYHHMTYILYQTYITAAMETDGAISEENLQLFFESLIQMYELCDLTEAPARDLTELYMTPKSFGAVEDVYRGDVKMALDYITDVAGIAELMKAETDKGISFSLSRSDTGAYYVPQIILGISAKTEHSEQAEQFIRFVFSAEFQKNIHSGFPVNRKALAEDLDKTLESELLRQVQLTAAEKQSVIEMLESLDTAVNLDSVVREIIMEQVQACFDGRTDAERAADTVSSKLDLYLSE